MHHRKFRSCRFFLKGNYDFENDVCWLVVCWYDLDLKYPNSQTSVGFVVRLFLTKGIS